MCLVNLFMKVFILNFDRVPLLKPGPSLGPGQIHPVKSTPLLHVNQHYEFYHFDREGQ